MVKCESLRMNMYRITHTGKVSKFSRNSSQFSYFTMRDLLSRLSTISPFCFPRSNNDRVFYFCFINDDCMAELLSLTDLKIPSS